jgi:diphosphomevalonate decarboxylase
MKVATAQAGANIAFIKYWGNLDSALRLPLTNSLSMTLDAATTITTVEFDPALEADRLILNGEDVAGPRLKRVSDHLDHLRTLKGVFWHARVVSHNTFPAGVGIASSASAFAALTVAAATALNLDLNPRQLSIYARLGSGSATRSIFGGFVEWVAAGRHEDSYAYQVASETHWSLVDAIAIISAEHKAVGSTEGHARASTSPLNSGRLAHVHAALAQARSAILARDIETLGRVMELDALTMHAVMMTSQPSLLYWDPGTLAVMHAVRAWRRRGIPAYFTIDAGPNVHVITLPEYAGEVQRRLRSLSQVKDVMLCRTGGGARVLEGKYHEEHEEKP